MTDDIDELIRDTLTPKDKPPPTDAFRAVAEAAALREREKWGDAFERHDAIVRRDAALWILRRMPTLVTQEFIESVHDQFGIEVE